MKELLNHSRILPELWILIRIEFYVIAGVDISTCVSHPDICVRMYNHSNSLKLVYYDYV